MITNLDLIKSIFKNASFVDGYYYTISECGRTFDIISLDDGTEKFNLVEIIQDSDTGGHNEFDLGIMDLAACLNTIKEETTYPETEEF